jgi:hypothetical protein
MFNVAVQEGVDGWIKEIVEMGPIDILSVSLPQWYETLSALTNNFTPC